LAFASFLSLLYYGYTPDRWDPNGWVEFIDVGQGDAALIRTPKGKHLLVDGGGTLTFRKPGEEWKERHDPFEVGRKTVVPLLKQRGVHQLDAVILSHEDQDHSGGLQAVVEEIPIKQFLFNGTLKPDTKVKTLFQTLLDQNIPIIGVHDNQEFKADAETALRFLYPFADHKEASDIRIAKQQNNYSLVFLLTMKGHTWLFTGDMEKDAEADILQSRNKPDYHPPVDVLKVAHHGSKTSTTEAWLDFWKPKVAVISVGARNVYGHPSPQVVSRLEEHKTELYRTDIQGAVRMEIGKDGISIRSKLDRF
jgi:competence protein ComEC